MFSLTLVVLFSLGVALVSGFSCPEQNGHYTNVLSPHSFWHCSNGHASLKPCPSSLVWSQFIDRCEYPDLITIPLTACDKETNCQNGGTCQPANDVDYYCLCAEGYYGKRCENVGTPDLSLLESLLNGNNNSTEQTVEQVLNRNNWTSILAVVDVTGSMQPCAAAVYKWMTLAHDKQTDIKYYVFFNDGDDKKDEDKIIGSTGGVYPISATDLSTVLATMQNAMRNGNGGDGPENDVEAIIKGIEHCPSCQNIILIADNGVTPRDLILLDRVSKPVKVLTCQQNGGAVNPKLLNLADKTGGSLHTITQDIINLSGIAVGETITIGKHTYKKTNSGYLQTS